MSNQPTGFSGLTAEEIMVQSAMCHPDWDVNVHLAYLQNEEGIAITAAVRVAFAHVLHRVITQPCFKCHKQTLMVVPTVNFERWKAGTHLQTAFPYMAAPQRELLKSGIHPACWDEMFKDEED